MFDGVHVIMTTHFREDMSIDEDALRRQIRFLLKAGVNHSNSVIVLTGSTGECHLLNLGECKRIWDIAMEEIDHETRVVCGVNRTSTTEVIELCKYASQIGADGVMNLAPFYWEPDDRAVLNHYGQLSNAVDIPIIVYNNMNVNQVDLSVKMLGKIAKLENVKAIKECTPQLEKMERLVRTVGDQVEVINGRGLLNEPYGYLMGTKGFSSIVANFAPDITVDLHQLAMAGQYAEFMNLKRKRIMPILDFISTLPFSQEAATVKAIEEILDISGKAFTRPPFLPLTPNERETLDEILHITEFLS